MPAAVAATRTRLERRQVPVLRPTHGRLRILRLIWDDELSAGEIAARFEATFGAVSPHLKVLRNTGLVTLRKDGTKRFHRADREAPGPLAEYLQSMWSARLDTLARLAEEAERSESTP